MRVRSVLPRKYAIASGVMWTLVSPLWGLWWLGPVVIAPLLYFAMCEESWKKILKEAFWTQIIFGLGTFFWIPITMQNLWRSPMIANWIFFLALISFSQIPILILAVTMSQLARRSLTIWKVVALSGFFTMLECIFPKFLNDTFGCILAGRPHVLSLVQFPLGTYCLTFMVMLINFLIVLLVLRRRLKEVVLVYVITAGLILGLPAREQTSVGQRALDIVAIDTNLTVEDLHNPEKAAGVAGEITQTLRTLSPRQGAPQIVVLPETVYPMNLLDATLPQNLELFRVIKERDLHVLIGSRINDGLQRMNATVYLHFEGDSLKTEFIAKRVLFPFGERIPLVQHLPFLKDKIGPPMLYDIPDRNQEYFKIFGLKIASLICYESIFPSLLYPIRNSIDLVVNPTNEVYFPHFGEPELSLGLTVLNSAENRVPIVRVSNAGLRGLIRDQSSEEVSYPQLRFDLRNYHLMVQKAEN